MSNTEEILQAGFSLGETKGNVLDAIFEKENLPTLATLLDAKGLSLNSVLGAGNNSLVFENIHGDATRVESTVLGIQSASLAEAIVLQKAAEFVFEDLQVKVSICIKAVPDDKGRTIDNEDLLRTASILHAKGKLDHWVDITLSQLMFIKDPTTNDLVRYPDGRAVAFIADTNSAFEGEAPQGMGSARKYLRETVFNCTDKELDAKLAAIIPADNPEAFLKAPEAQYPILAAARARYPAPTQITAATGAEVTPRAAQK